MMVSGLVGVLGIIFRFNICVVGVFMFSLNWLNIVICMLVFIVCLSYDVYVFGCDVLLLN